MKKWMMLCGVFAIGCGSGEATTLRIDGQVAPQARALDNAKAIATGADGKTYSAYLDPRGRFTVEVPIGQAYRLIVANTTPRGRLQVVGHVVNNGTSSSSWLHVKTGGELHLGTLSRTQNNPNALKTQCACGGGGDDHGGGGGGGGKDHGGAQGDDGHDDHGDYGSKENDDDHEKLCDDETDDDHKDVKLFCEHEPGEGYEGSGSSDDDEEKHGKCGDKDDSDGGSSSGDHGSSSGGSSSGDHGSSSGGSSSGDHGSSSGGSSSGGSSSGAPPAAGDCNCTSQCPSGDKCVANHCVKSGY